MFKNGKVFFPLAVAVVTALSPFGPASADVSISGVDDISINAWAGSSNDLEGSDTYCVLSCNNNCNRRRRYDVAAYTSGTTDGAGNFYLTHDGDGSTTLLVTFEWTNPVRGTFTMSHYSATGFTAPPTSPYAPGATSCAQANSQNTITIRVAEGDLASAIAGTYSETFSIDMCRLNGGGGVVECAAAVGFVVDIPELIQVTQMQDFSFGSWSGVGDMQGSNDFCVFRNGYGGFALTASGNNDFGGSFHVNDGTSDIPYSVEFSDGGTWHSATPSNQLSGATTGFTGDSTRDCGGGTSHSIRVTLQEADLAAAQAGNYSDTVTLLVEPE